MPSCKIWNAIYYITYILQPDELSFDEGEVLYIVNGVSDPNWLKARCGTRVGLVPGNYGMMKHLYFPFLNRFPYPFMFTSGWKCRNYRNANAWRRQKRKYNFSRGMYCQRSVCECTWNVAWKSPIAAYVCIIICFVNFLADLR